MRAGSIPDSRICSEDSENRASQVGILALWADMLRPINVRNVEASGTKAVGRGIRDGAMFACRHRIWVRSVLGVRIAEGANGRRGSIIAGVAAKADCVCGYDYEVDMLYAVCGLIEFVLDCCVERVMFTKSVLVHYSTSSFTQK